MMHVAPILHGLSPFALLAAVLCGCAPAQNTAPVPEKTRPAQPSAASPTTLLAGDAAKHQSPDQTTAAAIDATSSTGLQFGVIRGFLDTHCVRCHGEKTQEGQLRLDTAADDFRDPQSAARWLAVMDRLNLGEMPPPDEPRIDIHEQQQVTAWIASRLRSAIPVANARASRRLTRTEYANSVRDLLHVVFPPGEGPAHRLPPDGELDGFDKLAGSLSIDSALLAAYLDVAVRISEQAVLTGDVSQPPIPTERNRFEYEHTPIHPYEITTRPWTIVRPDGLVIMHGAAGSKDGLRHSHGRKLVPVPGRYTVRVRAGGSPGRSQKPLLMQLWRGGIGQTLLQCEVTTAIDNPQVHERTLWLEPEGNDDLNVFIIGGENFSVANELAHQMQGEVERALAAGDARAAGRLRAQMRAEGAVWMNSPNPATRDTANLPQLFLDFIEIEGPLYDCWPPKSHTMVLFEGPNAVHDLDYARRIIARLLPRAYRREVTPDEIDTILRVVSAEMEAGESFTASIRAGLTAILCSPSFLHVGASTGDADSFDEFRLAERLSYFLWSSLPDDPLLQAAARGQLHNPATLATEADRLLADPRSDALTTDFASQWLRTDEFVRFTPDRELYPDFFLPEFAGLDQDLQAEPLHFFRELLRTETSILAWLDADWTMANQRLAQFYGLAPLVGDEFRRVPLPTDSPRGGLLGMAGLHRLGSDGNRTKPVQRGVYLRDVLFNDPPNPPPPNAGEVQPNIDGQNLSVRARLAQHRTVPACAACHNGIDPYGLALENFNAIGRWRDVQDGEVRNWFARGGPPPIDASGALPDGRSFTGFAAFKQTLLQHPELFRRALAQKLLTYAIARRLKPTDRPVIDDIVQQAENDGDTLRAYVRAVVLSKAFVDP
jgi:hypothetical protein